MKISTQAFLTIVVTLIVIAASAVSPEKQNPKAAEAAEQERAARDARKWVASQKACQPGYVPIWTSDKDLECLRDITKAARP